MKTRSGSAAEERLAASKRALAQKIRNLFIDVPNSAKPYDKPSAAGKPKTLLERGFLFGIPPWTYGQAVDGG
jgi:hypothetical protein